MQCTQEFESLGQKILVTIFTKGVCHAWFPFWKLYTKNFTFETFFFLKKDVVCKKNLKRFCCRYLWLSYLVMVLLMPVFVPLGYHGMLGWGLGACWGPFKKDTQLLLFQVLTLLRSYKRLLFLIFLAWII